MYDHTVDAFHPAEVREQYHPNDDGAFAHDPDGNNVEAVCHRG